MALNSTRVPVPCAARTRHARAAALQRFHPEKVDRIVGAERDAAAIMLEDHIRRVVDDAPPLTAEQHDRLASLLRGPPIGAAS